MSVQTTTLWRPTGLREWELVAASGYLHWPPRLSDQPTFYPVLNDDYATRIARDWNAKSFGVGIVTRFEIETDYLSEFEVHQVGGETILEYWIPADRLDDFNEHIVGGIHETARWEIRGGELRQFSGTWVGAPRSCDQCPHGIAEHVLWEPEELEDGWMHCEHEECRTCWHDWPGSSRWKVGH